jgi:hypothetical protein
MHWMGMEWTLWLGRISLAVGGGQVRNRGRM